MKIILKYLIFVLFIGFFSKSYSQTYLNKFSIEGGYGYTGAVYPVYTEQIRASNYSGLNHFTIGVRYMYDQDFGAKLSYANDVFRNEPGGEYGVNFNRISLEGIYNVGRIFDLSYRTRDLIGLIGHVGGGFVTSKPMNYPNYERIGSITIGLTPQVLITKRIALYTDFTYVFNLKQHWRFAGELIDDKDYIPVVGEHFNVSFGIMIYLGENKWHSDWY
jgi:hypothetical protein